MLASTVNQPSTYDDFWNKFMPQQPPTGVAGAIPGMLNFGLDLYNRNAVNQEAAQRLAQARGPLYNQAMSGASGMLSSAGTFDPQAFANSRFQAHQALVAPVQQKQLDDLMSTLRGRGQLGISTYNPGVAGITPNGTAMNPQLAAFYAAQNAATAAAANDSMKQGQDYLDSLLRRSGMLSNQAANVQYSGLQGAGTQPMRSVGNAQAIKGLMGVLGNTGVLNRIPGMISSGVDWLKGLGGPQPTLGNFDFNFGGGDSGGLLAGSDFNFDFG